MTDFFETESFHLPSELRQDMAGRLEATRGIRSLELRLSGESLEGAKEFAKTLMDMKRSGVRITHELSIKLEFPEAISRERALSLVSSMPSSKNGLLKVRIELSGKK